MNSFQTMLNDTSVTTTGGIATARLVVHGGKPLQGSLPANGAKNAALPIMAATLLAKGPVTLRRVPNISDVWTLAGILKAMGCKVEYDGSGLMHIDSSTLNTTKAPEHMVRRMNASFDIMGPLLGAYGEGEVSLPGGCNLGSRPVDMHLAGFRKLGAEVTAHAGNVKAASSKRLQGAHILFPKVSVGATKNCLMAAVMAEGTTTLENCAREPEIVDLANFLVQMGANIEGIGYQLMRVHGVEKLQPVDYDVVADRIEVGTYLIAGAITGGDVTLTECVPDHVQSLLDLLREMGQEVEAGEDFVRVQGRPVRPMSVSTEPYPGFPTDLHPQLVALATLANGTSVVTENIFNGRFMYAMELVRLGADVRVSGRDVLIRGVKQLSGAPVDAPDIRAGGALVCAALAAQGESTISGVNFIDRGYQEIEKRLGVLGAKMERVDFEE